MLLLVLLCARSDLDILFREYTDHASGDFVVDHGLVVLADDINAKFLQKDTPGFEKLLLRNGESILTTMSSLFSS